MPLSSSTIPLTDRYRGGPDADLLITSPGSTTILHAMAINLPTLLLPPQNLSQILNARLCSKPGADTMQWPASVHRRTLAPAKNFEKSII
jgi:hypothetical protein